MSLVAYASSDDNSESEEDVPSQKKRQPVKISIPSLKEFKEEKDESTTKKLKPKVGSGLFSILPPPKNCTTSSEPGFTPYILSKKKEIKSPVIKKVKPNLSTDSSAEGGDPVLGSSADSSEKVDFFSLQTNESHDTTSLDVIPSLSYEKSENLTSDKFQPMNTTHSSFHQYVAKKSSESNSSDTAVDEVSNTSYPPNDDITPGSSTISCDLGSSSSLSDASSSADYLKDERFLKLKRKQDSEDINIIDVRAADQLTGKDEWLMQSLTEEKIHRPFKRRHDFPTQQQKRKHQITYLAYQAKEREMDLKNQWALNNRTRRETQAKYGF